MKNFYALLLVMSFVLISCGPSSIEGEGLADQSAELTLDDFHKIDATCNCVITIIPSDSSKVVIESHQNIIDNLDLKSAKGTLKIKEKASVTESSLYNVNVFVKPTLEEISLNGSTTMKISGAIKTDKFKLSASNQSRITESYLDVKDLIIEAYDQVEATLTGSSITLDAKTENSSIMDLSGLPVNEIIFSASENSKLDLYPRKSLKGKASDNALVTYLGDPTKETQVSGRAEINKK